MTTPHSGNAHPPRQARSRATHHRILTAASALLADAGWEGFTIEAVARRASVSVGAVYRRFGDKEGVFKAVHEAHLARLEARATTAFDPGSFGAGSFEDGAAVHEAIARLGVILEEHGALNAVLMVNANRFPGLGEHGALVMTRVRERVSAVLRAHSPAGGEIAVAACYRLAAATFSDFAANARFPTQRREMSWATLIAEVARACTGYLLEPRPVDR